ncbi:hypothetical protein WYI_13812 [Ochrobactrum sp. CDB2]|nr:hypothetical protein WYI_13812 [Ochrobactrum sp. CDB2]
MKLSSEFAILDVKRGRKKLAEHFKDLPPFGECPDNLRIPVTIHGYIAGDWGRDDGTSQEFSIMVEKLEVRP